MAFRSIRHFALALATAAILILPGEPVALVRAASSTVTVGLVADLSGAAGVYGVTIRNGAQLAADRRPSSPERARPPKAPSRVPPGSPIAKRRSTGALSGPIEPATRRLPTSSPPRRLTG